MKNSDASPGFRVEIRAEYIHILLDDNFELNPESVARIWQATIEACRLADCPRVLSEGRVRSRRLMAWDAYESGNQASEIRGLRQACLFYDYEPDEISEFFKTVSSNRGVAVEFFTDKEAALSWLGVKARD